MALGQLLWERLEFYFAMILNAFFIFSSTPLCVLRPSAMMKNKKIKTRLKLLQNKIPNAPIRVGLSTFFFDRKSEVENKNPDLIGRDLNHLRNKLR